MRADWPTTTIAEAAADEPHSTQIGPFGNKIRARIYTEVGEPVLRGTNVNTNDRFHDDDFVFVSEDYVARELAQFICRAGDVILCHKGTLGKIGIIPETARFERYVMGNSMLKVRCNPSKLEPLFLYYWLCSPAGQHYLYSRVSQVGVPQIQRPLSTLRAAQLPCPPIEEQRCITAVLGALDDKIELNRRMNETIEELARAIFKSWFVDFDPVHARAQGRQPAFMDAETAALFPDSFEDSALGPIPAGWMVTELGDLVEVVKGRSYKSAELQPSSTALVTLKSFQRSGGYRPDGLKPYTGAYKAEQVVEAGELVGCSSHRDARRRARARGFCSGFGVMSMMLART